MYLVVAQDQQDIIDIDVAGLIDVTEALAFVGPLVAVDIETGPVVEVAGIGHAVSIAVQFGIEGDNGAIAASKTVVMEIV